MLRTSPWPTVLGTAALIALPVLAAAQSAQPGSTGSQTSQPTTQSDTRYPVHSGAATQHLTEAKQVLDGIPRNAVKGRDAAKLAEIRREFASLQRSYEANPSISAESTSPSATPKTKRTAGHWNEHLMALDRDLTALLGPGDSMSSGSATSNPQASGTSGTTPPSAAGSTAASSALDANVKTQLEEFRKHISQFAAAASGTQPGGEMNPAEPGSSAAATEPSSATSSSAAQTGSATGTPTTPAPTSSATGETTQAQSTQTSGAQVDTNAARQHLSEARQSLADLTALPQAQQLQGDARTQVSQLISQFNQLITTQDQWRSSYDQVNATLTALLSSSAASSAPSSTQGAVGTSGSTNALDPALRTKLEEFRTHLQAFYSAAGGDAASSSAAGSSSSMSPTSPSSTGSSAEAETHIQAIEQILDQASGSAGATSGTAGTPSATAPATSAPSVTLTKEQIDQIRMHLQQLKASIKK